MPQDEYEWNDAELASLATLEREREPDPELEERTVARLEREGLIRKPEDARRPFWSRLSGAFTTARLGWASAAAALLAAVFLAGVAVGERWAVRSTAEALAAFHGDQLARTSARVQQTGSAYVSALAALGRMAADADPQELSQGREAALAALYAAATQLVRLDPDDPVATRLLQGLEEIRTADSGTMEDRNVKRQVVWF
jgi:hypothetical protein